MTKKTPEASPAPAEEVRVAPAVATVDPATRRVTVVLPGIHHTIEVSLKDPAARNDPRAAERAIDALVKTLHEVDAAEYALRIRATAPVEEP